MTAIMEKSEVIGTRSGNSLAVHKVFRAFRNQYLYFHGEK